MTTATPRNLGKSAYIRGGIRSGNFPLTSTSCGHVGWMVDGYIIIIHKIKIQPLYVNGGGGTASDVVGGIDRYEMLRRRLPPGYHNINIQTYSV